MKVKGTARSGRSGSRQLCTPPQTDTGVSQLHPLRQERQGDTQQNIWTHREVPERAQEEVKERNKAERCYLFLQLDNELQFWQRIKNSPGK